MSVCKMCCDSGILNPETGYLCNCEVAMSIRHERQIAAKDSQIRELMDHLRLCKEGRETFRVERNEAREKLDAALAVNRSEEGVREILQGEVDRLTEERDALRAVFARKFPNHPGTDYPDIHTVCNRPGCPLCADLREPYHLAEIARLKGEVEELRGALRECAKRACLCGGSPRVCTCGGMDLLARADALLRESPETGGKGMESSAQSFQPTPSPEPGKGEGFEEWHRRECPRVVAFSVDGETCNDFDEVVNYRWPPNGEWENASYAQASIVRFQRRTCHEVYLAEHPPEKPPGGEGRGEEPLAFRLMQFVHISGGSIDDGTWRDMVTPLLAEAAHALDTVGAFGPPSLRPLPGAEGDAIDIIINQAHLLRGKYPRRPSR